MNMKFPADAAHMLDQIRRIDAAGTKDGVSRKFLEVRQPKSEDAIYVSGNVEGLIHFARAVLDIAAKGFEGAHHHFDEHGVLDHCDIPIVVSLKAAEWDVP
jgi:hypothetical protein